MAQFDKDDAARQLYDSYNGFTDSMNNDTKSAGRKNQHPEQVTCTINAHKVCVNRLE